MAGVSTMKALLGLSVAAGIAALLPATSMAQGCLNSGSTTCSSAREQCHAIRGRLGRQSSDCDPAYKRCMKDGTWITTTCHRSGLKKV